MIDPSDSLGTLVAEEPGRAELFERLRLDYCCGGGETLATACARRGLDVDTVCQLLVALDGPPLGRRLGCGDWRSAPLGELCDHIIATHHDELRRELPRTAELLATVVRVHGKHHRELHDLQRLFATMRHELESHIQAEEVVVFPLCRAAETGRIPVDADLLALHEHEHADTGDALAAVRELTHDYDTTAALCRTHRTLLESLRRLELDLHQHIHEENNILFPRARALADLGHGR